MKITNKKNLSVIISIILLFAILAGCFGGSDESSKPKKTFNEMTGDMTLSGWAESDWESDNTDPFIVDEVIDLNLNSSRLSYVKVKIQFEDADAAHTETDDGSDPDEFTVVINSSDVESKPVSGETPGSIELEIPPSNASSGTDDPIEFGPKVSIHIMCNCHGGKAATLAPRPGIIPGPFVYVDQGIAYSITIEYTYFADE